MRLVNAVRELRVERGEDVRTIALHTAAERAAMFVREADEAVLLDGTYLDLGALERALVAARADAAWVGWGFVAERPEFAELCDRLGITFVGPSAEVMRKLGDKIGAKLLAEAADVPVAAWSGGPVETIEAAHEHARRIGYPLMIKATSGGGGRGIRRVDGEAGLAEAFESARSEGLKAFGDATVFMERVVTGARHVEVQLIADHHGTAWAVGVRDCSMQRRNQKVIEESQCTVLTAEQDRDLRAAAVRLAGVAGYQNAGTVEFLYQPAEQRFAFLEVNTRLQVEHPVTELTTGLDLVKLQLHVAAGGRLEGEPPPTVGYAIEARLNAEDPQRAFAPAPGTIEVLTLPVGPGVRVDTGVAEGDVIPPEYDSMIAKVIAAGRDRGEALSRLHRALSQMTVVVDGGTTNRSFLLDLLERPEVRAGDVDTSWLDRLTAADEHLPTRHADVALVAAAIDVFALLAASERTAFLSWAERGRPQADASIGRHVELRHGGQSYEVAVRQLAPDRFAVSVEGVHVVARAERLGRRRTRLTIGDTTFAVVSSDQGSDHLVEVDGVAHRFSRDDAGIVRAPAAALVVGVDVEPGDLVGAGDRLGVVEAMKMEIAVPAPVAGRVRDVFVARNVQVAAGAALFRIEPTDGDEATGDGRRIAVDGARRRRAGAGRAAARVPPRLRRRHRRGPRRARPLAVAGPNCSTSSPTSPRSRPSAATPAPTTTVRRVSTSRRSCGRSTSSGRACRRGSGTPCAGRRPLRHRRRWTRRRTSRTRCCGSSCRGNDATSSCRSCSPCSTRRRHGRAPTTTGCASRSTGSSSAPAGATPRSPPRRATCATGCSTDRTSCARAPRRRRACSSCRLPSPDPTSIPSSSTSSSLARCRSCRSSPPTTCSGRRRPRAR